MQLRRFKGRAGMDNARLLINTKRSDTKLAEYKGSIDCSPFRIIHRSPLKREIYAIITYTFPLLASISPIDRPTRVYHSLKIRKLSNIMRRTLIPPGILIQIQLMISLRIPPLPRRQDFCRHSPLLPPLLLDLLRNLLSLHLLLVVMVEDCGTVLRAGIHALAVLGGGVVHLVEEGEEGFVV